MQADGVVRLLVELENALAGNNIDEFRRLTATTIAPSESSMFAGASFADGQDFAAVRERDRRPTHQPVHSNGTPPAPVNRKRLPPTNDQR